MSKEKPEVMGMQELLDAMKRASSVAAKPTLVPIKGVGNFYVRPLTVAEMEKNLEADGKLDDRRKNAFARGLARLVCHPDGARMFDPPSDDVVATFASLSWEQMQPLMAAGQVDATGVDEKGN